MSIDPVLLQQIINGLSLGAMYALLALGFTLVYGILELINFAHFNVFMVSSFIGMWALELLGLSGQSTVLGGFELVGSLGFAFIVTKKAKASTPSSSNPPRIVLCPERPNSSSAHIPIKDATMNRLKWAKLISSRMP